SEFALELARKYTAERDYETALMYMNDHINTVGDVTAWQSNFYLYLLAKDGLAEQAAPIIANLRLMGEPGIDRFLDWHAETFGQFGITNSEVHDQDAPQVAEYFD
ncbi:MAG: hypothetical protein OEM63_16005, partial [Gammaproteobacteria bacterium]|nr:hypothetical protein [Gammaproteobacteria bacterium]